MAHPSSDTLPIGQWPVACDPTQRYRLLTLLDAATLKPVKSAPIFAIRPAIAVDASGTVWIIADGMQPLLSNPCSGRIRWMSRRYSITRDGNIPGCNDADQPIDSTRHHIKWRLNSRWTNRKPKRSQIVSAGWLCVLTIVKQDKR